MRSGSRLEAVAALGCVVSIAWICRYHTTPRHPAEDLEVADVKYLRPIVKSWLARDLVAGRRSLIEVAALFEKLDAVPPAYADIQVIEDDSRSGSSDERQCRRVILWAEYIMDESDERRAQVINQLNDQLHRVLVTARGIQLPVA